MNQTILKIDQLSISLPSGLPLVDKVSFSLDKGDILGLVGESGSGKTLTCRAIMQLLPSSQLKITQGTALFEEQDIFTMSQKQLRKIRGKGIGMIFQNPSSHLNPLMTIGAQMLEAIRMDNTLSKQQAKKKGIELLAKVGIPSPEKRFSSYVHEFSGGMRQRAMIAIALAASPKVLIADEPTTALDVTVQAQILKLLQQLRDELGVAIIMITHDLGVVAQLCNRVAVLYGGRICEIGRTKEILASPYHPYTKGLIECQPLFEDKNSNARYLTTIDGTPPIAQQMPSGCRFHPRCNKALPECAERVPQPQQINSMSNSAHTVSCHLPLFPNQESK